MISKGNISQINLHITVNPNLDVPIVWYRRVGWSAPVVGSALLWKT